jgi:hypothetical protein
MGHSISLGGVTSRDRILHQYFYNKWGYYPGGGHETKQYYATPFNIEGMDIKYCPKEHEKFHVSKIVIGRYGKEYD